MQMENSQKQKPDNELAKCVHVCGYIYVVFIFLLNKLKPVNERLDLLIIFWFIVNGTTKIVSPFPNLC